MRSLSLREKRLVQVAALLAVVLLVSLVLRGGGAGSPPVPAPAQPAPTPTALPSSTAAPAPVPAVPAAPAAAPAGLRLHGLLASGAVISIGGGGQRLVPVGREAAPGLTVVRVEQGHAILRGPAGEIRLGFEEAGQPAPAVVRPAP